ncbi:hypothetical protein LPJ62_006688, partial [Coemansia sp. RSA 2167]
KRRRDSGACWVSRDEDARRGCSGYGVCRPRSCSQASCSSSSMRCGNDGGCGLRVRRHKHVCGAQRSQTAK